MKKTLKFLSTLFFFSLIAISCSSSKDKDKDSKTGWSFNNPDFGNYLKGDANDGSVPPGMILIEGGTFTMGSVQDDVMFDWNTTPQQMHVRSFYMDETEVTNSEYSLYLQYMRDVFPPDNEEFSKIYPAILPDTLVWRRSLGNTNLLSENYFRHPSYADYPVVGINWLQASKYCQWRTNAVNLKILMDKGIIKNIFKEDSVKFEGENNFDTKTYLADPYAIFGGDSTIYKKGLPVKGNKKKSESKDGFEGRHVTSSDGIMVQTIRLPTEVEWEYAAKANFENREYNNIRGRKKYAWASKYTRNRTNKNRGDQMANYKQSKGNYSNIAGWSSDNADIPNKVKSYPPNAFGLYEMSGNVAEWVQDVYRPIIDSEANDFNYFRGNIFTKVMIDSTGKSVIVGDTEIKYDTLVNGVVVPKDLPGSVKYIPVTKKDVHYRTNYNTADNVNFNDGDNRSSKDYTDSESEGEGEGTDLPRMYNSPVSPKDSLGGISIEYDKGKRTTLISDQSRVYKGGSWADRAYWLDPAQRRYLPQDLSTSFIGFRCATDKVGPMSDGSKRRPLPRTK